MCARDGGKELMNKADFEALALAVIEEIPVGQVASYGQIAALMGYPGYARQVGRACACSEYYGHYPCHRVVNSQGRLVPNWGQQQTLLAMEGVGFKENGCVDMRRFQWKK